MNIKLGNLLHGGGTRRKSDESWADLQRQLSYAQYLLKTLNGAVRNTCQAGLHGPFWVVQKTPVPCPWCEIGRLRAAQVAQVVIAPALPAGQPRVPAAVDRPDFQPLPDAPLTSADDRLLLMPDAPVAAEEVPIADVNAETQAVAVSDLWKTIGEDATTLLPAVVAPVLPVVAEPSSSGHMEPARVDTPPDPRLPPAHLVEQQLVTWGTDRTDVTPADLSQGRTALVVLGKGGARC